VTESAVSVRRANPLWQIGKALILLAVLVILVGLGTWQVQRLHWKEGLLADIAARKDAPAVPLSAIEAMAASGGDIEYRVVTTTGHYLNNKERDFLATYAEEPGFHIYTPLQLDDGRFVFVNRAFCDFLGRSES